ncbi:MAG: transposase [Planctomycetes bacterium]|nr:transposase [Planctomycetota bacterium]
MRGGTWQIDDPDEPQDHALDRSCVGLTCRIHLLCDVQGHPLHFQRTAEQAYESTLLDDVLIDPDQQLYDGQGEPLAWPAALAGNKGYRADWIDSYLLELAIQAVIPSKSNGDRNARSVAFDHEVDRGRNSIELLVGWLKECRRICSRFGKAAKNFGGMIKMAFIRRHHKLPTLSVLRRSLICDGQMVHD